MKNAFIKLRNLIITGMFMILSLNSLNAQQIVADFEDLTLAPDTCWYGIDSTGGYSSGELFFANKFTDWGVYTSWAGFAYSNKVDTLTSGFGNQYSAYSGHAHNGSENFGIYYNDGMSTYRMSTKSSLVNDTLSGFYITNDTYTALSMKYGDAFTKKFGGTSGDDPDWFMLTIYGFKNGVKKTDTVNFYLADYRFSNNSLDYILKEWTFVDIQILGKVDSIEFKLRSTDNGTYGMNTPAYFCFDNFYKKTGSSAVNNYASIQSNCFVYPNPASDNININSGLNIRSAYIYNVNGSLLEAFTEIDSKAFNININSYNSGVYLIKCVDTENGIYYSKFMKK